MKNPGLKKEPGIRVIWFLIDGGMYIYPPKSSNEIFSSGTPNSSSAFMTD